MPRPPLPKKYRERPILPRRRTICHTELDQVLISIALMAFYLARAVAPAMMKRGQGGSIVALGGFASMTSQPQRAHVITSKTGLYGFIKAPALELGPYNIRAIDRLSSRRYSCG